jgi:hypothetical protein
VAFNALASPSARLASRTVAEVRGSSGRVALVLAAIAVATLLALAYLTQTLGTRADQYETDSLLHQQVGLLQELQSQGGTIANAGSQKVVEEWVARNQLSDRGTKLSIKAR